VARKRFDAVATRDLNATTFSGWIGSKRVPQTGDTKKRAPASVLNAIPIVIRRIQPRCGGRLPASCSKRLTLLAGIVNAEQTRCNRVYLTLFGCGAFGNSQDWILDAMFRVLKKK
jgi:hypothetical protein